MQADRQLWCISMFDLVPTQATMGMREVDFKRRRWRQKSADEKAAYVARNRVPVVLGPSARRYLIDGHHLTRALHDEGVLRIPYFVHANMGGLEPDDFWRALERLNWAHPFDEAGERRAYEDMPKTLADTTDDVFRSLAGALKRAGGYAKEDMPFSEFQWADFLRHRVPKALVEGDFDQALSQALAWSGDHAAAALPGWRGRADPTALTPRRLPIEAPLGGRRALGKLGNVS